MTSAMCGDKINRPDGTGIRWSRSAGAEAPAYWHTVPAGTGRRMGRYMRRAALRYLWLFRRNTPRRGDMAIGRLFTAGKSDGKIAQSRRDG